MVNKKNIILFTGIYVVLRIFSYFFGPATPLQPQNWLNATLTIIILLISIFWLCKNDERGWYIIALEIILGGGGNYLAAFGLTLRTWLLIISIPIFAFNIIRSKDLINTIREEKNVLVLFCLVWLAATLATFRGIYLHHNLSLVFSDLIPYAFLAYYFPFKKLVNNEKFRGLAWNAIIAAVICNAIFVLLTFIGYSSGLFVMQDNYYHWYRDVAGGKITELGHYYRLVLNEHILLAPLLIWLSERVINKKGSKIDIVLSLLLVIILSLNLTRIYIVAIIVGYLLLLTKKIWKNWIIFGITIAFSFALFFTSIHFIASRGQSFGWELFGIRLQSIVTPQIEDSSLSRMLLLPKILDKIKTEPILGYGFGDTVTVYSPVFKKELTTAHFDWGYLEIMAELGLIGALVWLALIISIIKKNLSIQGNIAAFGALLVINITSPALFHVLGIILLVILLTGTKKLSVN